MKIQIQIPLRGLSENQKFQELEELNNYYENFQIVESVDEKIHFEHIDTIENKFGIIVNTKGLNRQKAEEKCYEIICKYNDTYNNCEIIVLPSQIEENKVIKLTNTEKELDLLF